MSSYHNELLRTYRPRSYQEHGQCVALLADPMDFGERFDGVLLHLGRWPYEHIAEVQDVLMHRCVNRQVNGGTPEQYEADRQAILDAFAAAGWTWEDYEAELERRLDAKFALAPA